MDNEPLLPAHLNDLAKENQRPRSIRERRLTVMRTNRRMGRPVAEFTKADLRAWQDGIVTRLTPAGQHVEIVHVTQYIKWVHRQGYRPDDPCDAVIRPVKIHQGLPRPMADADIGRAILTAPHPERAWIALGAFCGLRCMEIASLTRAAVRDNQRPPVLDIVGKGGKNRIIPLPATVIAELRAAGMGPRGYIWERMDGGDGPPSAMRVSERINKHLKSLGINETAHALRHRFGTQLYRETHDLYLVARVMGHASIDTTKIYVLADPFDAVGPVDAISTLNLN